MRRIHRRVFVVYIFCGSSFVHQQLCNLIFSMPSGKLQAIFQLPDFIYLTCSTLLHTENVETIDN